MSKQEKLLKKLQASQQAFTYSELKSLLNGLGYVEFSKGKTSGSRVAFINTTSNHVLRLHKPHPGDQLKRYQKDQILEELIKNGVIK